MNVEASGGHGGVVPPRAVLLVPEAVGRALAGLGADTVFGVVGSGNFHVTNALVAGGARYFAARHESGAAVMADAWARVTGRTGVLTVHQGPGLTNAMTGIAEAAKSRTPLLVLAAETPEKNSNFYLDVAALAHGVGAEHLRTRSPASAVADACAAFQLASTRRTVVLSLPLDVQAQDAIPGQVCTGPLVHPPTPSSEGVEALADLLAQARRPVFIAGRGARGARAELERAADACGALLATSAVAKGLFADNPWNLDVSGGFATPRAAELIRAADVIVAWGCSLNMWTTRHGALIGAQTIVAQIDDDPAAIGRHRAVHLGVIGDVRATAVGVAAVLAGMTDAVSSRGPFTSNGKWRDEPFTDESDASRIDPRTLTIALDDILPAERTVAVDSGNFMGYPAMFLSVPDEAGFCFTQGFQSIGLGLATAIGAAVARPDRLTVAALGDGGALMGISELETAVRLGLGMVVLVYDDEAYGAEVHHFGPDGHPLDTVRFPPADIAAIGRGFGCDGIVVRSLDDLAGVEPWLSGPRKRPLVIDAKIVSTHGSWWLEEAFRGH